MTAVIHVTLAPKATEQTITDIWTAIRDRGRNGAAEIILTVRTNPGETDIHLGLKRVSSEPDFLAYLQSLDHIESVQLSEQAAA